MPQSAGSIAARAELLVGAEPVLMLFLRSDLIGDDDDLGAEAVESGVVVDALEQMSEHDSVRRIWVGVAGVEARYIDSSEDVADTGVSVRPQDSRVDACGLAMFPAESAPVSFASHEFVAVELRRIGDIVVPTGGDSDGVVALFDTFPCGHVGDGCTDEVEVAVVRLIEVRDQHCYATRPVSSSASMRCSGSAIPLMNRTPSSSRTWRGSR